MRGVQGGNEVAALKKCQQCQLLPEAPNVLYLRHISAIIDWLRCKSAQLTVAHSQAHVTCSCRNQGLEVFMFDDMIRDWPVELLEQLAATEVNLVVWNYSPDLKGPL